MITTEKASVIPAALQADIRVALDKLARGIRDPEAARKACERMDRMREENKLLLGELSSAVEIIREIRDSQ